jgi:hypothetical protein
MTKVVTPIIFSCSSGVRWKVIAAIGVNELGKLRGLQDFYSHAPSVEMPGHFEMAGGVEAHQHGPILEDFAGLRRVKLKTRSTVCRIGREFPYNLPIFLIVVK